MASKFTIKRKTVAKQIDLQGLAIKNEASKNISPRKSIALPTSKENMNSVFGLRHQSQTRMRHSTPKFIKEFDPFTRNYHPTVLGMNPIEISNKVI